MQNIKCLIFHKITWIYNIRRVSSLSKSSMEVLTIPISQEKDMGQFIQSQRVVEIVVDWLFVVVLRAEMRLGK